MSGDDTPAATIPKVPKRARTAVKRPDPIETKNRMKGKMHNINKKPPKMSSSTIEKAASLKEKEVAEALFDLANLAGTDLENGEDMVMQQTSDQLKKDGKKNSKSKSKHNSFAMHNKGGKMGKNDGGLKQGMAGMPQNVPWQQGMPHPAFSQNLYSQMMAWQQASFGGGMPNPPASQPMPPKPPMPAAPVKSLKRCANHVYIAHLIYYHQRMQQASLMQTMGMNLATGNPAALAGMNPQLPADAASLLQQQMQNQQTQNQQQQQQQQQQPQTGDGKAPSSQGNPLINNFGGLQAQLSGLKSEQDANALKAQLLQMQQPNPAVLSLLGGGMPGMQAQMTQLGGSAQAEALAALAAQAALGAQAAGGLNPAAAQQMQQYASQLQNSMTMMQQPGSFPVMPPPGQFPMQAQQMLGQSVGLTPQQMAAFYMAAGPSALGFANAAGGGLGQDATAAAAMQAMQAAGNMVTTAPGTSQDPGSAGAAAAAFSGGMPVIPPQLMASLQGSGDPQAAAAAALQAIPGVDMKQLAGVLAGQANAAIHPKKAGL
jgi:hypothetical protein